MVTREPKCVQWKRRGAERVAALLSGLGLEQELKFWQEKSKDFERLQAEGRKRHKQPRP